MKEDKICFKKNLLYLFFISVFAVLFIVTVNYLNSQTKAAGTRASGCQAGVSKCGDGTLAGQCSKSSGKNNGYRCGCFGGTTKATLKYDISFCPKSSLIPTPAVGGTVANVTATCQAIKGKVSRTIANYNGKGVVGYDHFNGMYYSTTKKTPNVTPIPGNVLSAYCATEGKITMANVTTEDVPSGGTASAAAYTVQELATNCATIKGQVSRTVANYGGPGAAGYDHFNGNYYSTTTKTPNVTPIPGKIWSAYCATEGKITMANVTTEDTSSCGATVCAGGEAQGTCAKTVARRRCMCPTGTTYARYVTDESCILPTP